jgi:hypothetical protein
MTGQVRVPIASNVDLNLFQAIASVNGKVGRL